MILEIHCMLATISMLKENSVMKGQMNLPAYGFLTGKLVKINLNTDISMDRLKEVFEERTLDSTY